MATRCQVLIVSEPKGTPGRATGRILAALYHHWDGYPGNMLKLFQEARERVSMHAASVAKEVLATQTEEYRKREAQGFKGSALAPGGWTPQRHAAQAHRLALSRSMGLGHLASWIVAQEPDGYEVEPHTAIHGDVEFIYRLSSARTGEVDEVGDVWDWFVRVDAFCFSAEDRDGQLERREGDIILDWSRIDSPAVDAMISEHEKRVAAYQAQRAAENAALASS